MTRHDLTPPNTRGTAPRGMPHSVPNVRMSRAPAVVDARFASPSAEALPIRELPGTPPARFAHRRSAIGGDAQPKSP